MYCEWTERVSAYLDGELSPAEALRVREHLSTCLLCRTAQGDFQHLREEMKHSFPEVSPARQATALDSILHQSRWVSWMPTISIPAPVFVATLVVAALTGYFASRQVEAPANRPAEVKPAPTGQPVSPLEPAIDFSKYDHGGRASVVVVKRPVATETGGGL